MKYVPMFLSWARSYEQELEEFKNLISAKPSDVRQLREELRELKNRGAIYEEKKC